MRVALLCGSSARSRYVAHRLAARLELACVISEVGRDYSIRKLVKYLDLRTLRSKAYRGLRPFLFPPDVDPNRCLFPEGRAEFPHGVRLHRTAHINLKENVGRLRDARVDAVAVFGTSLLRNDQLFAACDGPWLNLHGGISPHYRGADSIFWALFHRDTEHVGATVHAIDRRIDAGTLIAHARPAVEIGDRELGLTCKSIALGAHVLAEAFSRLAAGELLGAPQPGGGRLFQVRDRRYVHDARVRAMFRDGLLGRVSLPKRVTWYERPGIQPVDPRFATAPSEPGERAEALTCR